MNSQENIATHSASSFSHSPISCKNVEGPLPLQQSLSVYGKFGCGQPASHHTLYYSMLLSLSIFSLLSFKMFYVSYAE